MRDLAELFFIVEEHVLLAGSPSKHDGKHDSKQKLILLRMANNILKKLSITNDTSFRGRVQMFITAVFPLSEKSGVNLKGTLNTQNVTLIDGAPTANAPATEFDFPFYRNFWLLQRLIENPFLVPECASSRRSSHPTLTCSGS